MSTNPELSVIVPTLNEYENIQKLVSVLTEVLGDTSWEVFFVDDNSSDNTSQILREIAEKNSRVRYMERINRTGLSSAIIEGISSTSSHYICVMDADLQHDARIIPDMLSTLKQGSDLVVGSRYIENASTGELPKHRVLISRFATYLCKLIIQYELKDPLSGFFMLRRDLFEKLVDSISGRGFKILLEVLVAAQNIQIQELPYHMNKRDYGRSKLGVIVIWEFFRLLINKSLGRL